MQTISTRMSTLHSILEDDVCYGKEQIEEGKRVMEQQGRKKRVKNHEYQQVRYNALLAVQKLMVHNWDYLGKQLQSEQPQTAAARS